MKRTVFFISDHTGITAEAMGHSLLSQFGNLRFNSRQHSFIDNLTKAHLLVEEINLCAEESDLQPLAFCTLVEPALRNCLQQSKAAVFDLFSTFTRPLEKILSTDASPASGLVHGISNAGVYSERIQAMNYALINDDGAITRNYEQADLILVGVSRSGKTPTSLYLGLQYSVLTANYPLIHSDLDDTNLPQPLQPYQHKLFGLTIEPGKLQLIREQRRPQSQYASLQQCQFETNQARIMFQQHDIPHIDTTTMPVEEIAARILARRFDG